MKRTYDLAISLGGACGCSKSLRNAGLQFSSFPFDWLKRATLRDRVEVVLQNFDGWLDAGLEKLKEPDGVIGESHWRERKYGFALFHDFDRLTPIEKALPVVKEKYARRAKNMFRLIAASRRVLLVWIDVSTSPPALEEDLRHLQRAFCEKWPGVIFDVLAFRLIEGVPLEKRAETEADGLRVVMFDYLDKRVSPYGVLLADDRMLGQWLATEYEVIDYRTPEEIRRWKRISKLNEYRQFGGKNWLGYFIGRSQYKIYKHFKKILQRKGVV